jgi:molybdenum cofactor synthesis domain-containing protein
MINFGILTISDKGSKGQREDKSGEVIRDIVLATHGRVVKYEIVPDEKDIIAATLSAWADSGRIDIILTTGGTGLSKRDVTPEATLSIVDRQVPGLAEAMRAKSLDKTPTAMLSRAAAGQRKDCLIVNMPGSVKAVRECLEIILPALPHAVEIIKGVVTEHSIEDAAVQR